MYQYFATYHRDYLILSHQYYFAILVSSVAAIGSDTITMNN